MAYLHDEARKTEPAIPALLKRARRPHLYSKVLTWFDDPRPPTSKHGSDLKGKKTAPQGAWHA